MADPDRAMIADEISEYVRAGTNVHLVGLRSSGRSGLLRSVAERLQDDGVAVARMWGMKALQDRPLAAMAASGFRVTPGSHHLQLLTSAMAALEGHCSDGPSALVIDDVDFLDTTALGAIIAVQERLGVPVLYSSRPSSRHDGAVAMLTAGVQPVVRLSSPPLRFDEVHQLVHTLLGGSVAPAVVAQVFALSGGLPGLARAVVDTARRNQRVVYREGTWVSRGDLWTSALSAAVEPLLTDLSETALQALTTLAVSGTTSLDRALHITSTDLLAELDECGLVQIRALGADSVVGVFPPLVAEFLTKERSLARRVGAERVLASVPDSPEETRVTGRQEPFRVPDIDPVLVHRMTRHWRDELTRCRATWEAERDCASAAALLEALLSSGARHYELDEVMLGTDTSGAEPAARAHFAATAALSEKLLGQRGEAKDRLAGLRPPGYSGLFAAIEQHTGLLSRRLPPEHGPAEPDSREHRIARDAQRVAMAEARLARGDAAAALELLDGLALEELPPRLERLATVIAELALVCECRLDDAIAQAGTRLHRAHERYDAGGVSAHAYVAALALMLQGRLVEVVDLTSAALAVHPTPSDEQHFQIGLITVGAFAAMLEGRVDYARSLARQAAGFPDSRGPWPGMEPGLVGAVVELGESSEAADALWDAAERRWGVGEVAAGMIAGVLSIERRPDAERALMLTQVAATTTTPLFAHMAAYAAALGSGDPDRVEQVVPDLRRAGLRMYAVGASVRRAIGLRREGRWAEAAALTHAVWVEAGLRGRDLCGLYTTYDREVNLSARERQIAVMVAKGMNCTEIATKMVLSVRTVENHVFNACRKIGIDNREELGWAASSWLTCVPR